jgi:hypothetical protein
MRNRSTAVAVAEAVVAAAEVEAAGPAGVRVAELAEEAKADPEVERAEEPEAALGAKVVRAEPEAVAESRAEVSGSPTQIRILRSRG